MNDKIKHIIKNQNVRSCDRFQLFFGGCLFKTCVMGMTCFTSMLPFLPFFGVCFEYEKTLMWSEVKMLPYFWSFSLVKQKKLLYGRFPLFPH